MSTKGLKQSAITKYKIGLANSKDRAELLEFVKDYISDLPDNELPSITDCAIHAHISESALLNYEARSEDNSEIRKLLTLIRDRQKSHLIKNGLLRKYDSRLTGRLLEINHGLAPKPQNLTQNNIFNISPELLAEALELSKKK